MTEWQDLEGWEYLPVEGCEECEFFETACPECILYGEAKEVRMNDIGYDDIFIVTYLVSG